MGVLSRDGSSPSCGTKRLVRHCFYEAFLFLFHKHPILIVILTIQFEIGFYRVCKMFGTVFIAKDNMQIQAQA